MTRVMKGPNGGRPMLECTRARAGAGCEYRAMHLQAVEEAITANVTYLAGTAPSGRNDLDTERERLEAREATEQQIGNVIDAIASGAPSPSLK